MSDPRLTALVKQAIARIEHAKRKEPETTSAIRTLTASGEVWSRYAGEAFWTAGQPADCFLVLLNGCVEIVAPGKGEQRNVLGIMGPGDVVGLPAVLGRSKYPATANAISFRVDALRVPGAILAQRDSKIMRALLWAMLLHDHVLRTKIMVLAAGSVERRLALVMRHLDERFGDGKRERRVLHVDLSRAQLASLVGARIETVIRILAKWKRAGWFSDHLTGFELDTRRLEALLNRI